MSCAVLYPAVAEVVRRTGAVAVGLVDVGPSTAINLEVDRVGITYSNGQVLGDPTAAIQLSSALVGARPLPERPLPRVVTRTGIGWDRAELGEALHQMPRGALVVVITTWALSRVRPARRDGFRQDLAEAAARRTIAWVSVEGVGVAPGVPTLGDRPASGHSIIGLTLFDGVQAQAEALGRCWSRGRWVSWLSDSAAPSLPTARD